MKICSEDIMPRITYSTCYRESFVNYPRNERKDMDMDQSAAFNVLDSYILQVKLDPLNFSPTACKLIKDYLSGRQNKVIVTGHLYPKSGFRLV